MKQVSTGRNSRRGSGNFAHLSIRGRCCAIAANPSCAGLSACSGLRCADVPGEQRGQPRRIAPRHAALRCNPVGRPDQGSQGRSGLAAGGRRIRTLGPPVGDSIFSRPPRNPATTNRPGSQNRILTIDKGRFTVRRARLAPAMISTPGHRASRRRQRGALPAWSRDAFSAPSTNLAMLRLAACARQR